MVRIAEGTEEKPPRFSIYGFKSDGLQVKIDTIYLWEVEHADAAHPRADEPPEEQAESRAATLRLAAATLAHEVLASKQNVGKYLRGLAERVLDEADRASASPVEGQGWQHQHAVYSELQMQHARSQENANGFQKGWHAALTRVADGTDMQELRELVPNPALSSLGATEPDR